MRVKQAIASKILRLLLPFMAVTIRVMLALSFARFASAEASKEMLPQY
jgi:hypothetical protein